jgi:hypothetical protein
MMQTCISSEIIAYLLLKSLEGHAMAAATVVVGPATLPSVGDISNTLGSSSGGSFTPNPLTRIVDVFLSADDEVGT